MLKIQFNLFRYYKLFSTVLLNPSITKLLIYNYLYIKKVMFKMGQIITWLSIQHYLGILIYMCDQNILYFHLDVK